MRIIVPDPSRLFPPRFRSSRVSGPNSMGEDFLSLAALPMILAGAIGAGALAAKLMPWLAIPGGFLGGALLTGILESLPLCGILESAFYSYITFVLLGGRDDPSLKYPLILAGAVTVLFLWMAYRSRQRR